MRLKKKSYFIISLFFIAAILLLLFAIYKVSDVQFERGFVFYVYFDFTGGLLENSPVMVSGVKIGKVKNIEFKNIDNKTKIRLTIWLERDLKIKTDAKVSIEQAGLMGEKYVEIDPGTAGMPDIKEGQVLIGITPQKIQELFTEAQSVLEGLNKSVAGFNEVFIEKEIKKEIRKGIYNLSNSFKDINDIMKENKDRINITLGDFSKTAENLKEGSSILKDVAVQNTEKIRKFVKNIDKLSENLKNISTKNYSKLNNIIKNLETSSENMKEFIVKNKGLISDSIENMDKTTSDIYLLVNSKKESLENSIDNLSETMNNTKNASATLKNILDENEKNIAETLTNVNTSLKSLTKVLSSMSVAIDTINKGEGLIGKAVFDKKIGDRLDIMTKNLEIVIRYATRHPWVLFKKGTTITQEDYDKLFREIEEEQQNKKNK